MPFFAGMTDKQPDGSTKVESALRADSASDHPETLTNRIISALDQIEKMVSKARVDLIQLEENIKNLNKSKGGKV